MMRSRLAPDRFLPQYKQIYRETFSDSEIDGIYAFYTSSAGRATIAKGPLIASQIMNLMQGEMGDIMREVEKIVRESTESARPGTSDCD